MKLAAILLVYSAAAAAEIAIRAEQGAYIVSGWKPTQAPEAGWASVFAVYAGNPEAPSLLGEYTIESGQLVFRPRFAPAPGVRTRAVFSLPGRTPVEAVFEPRTQPAQPAARVEQVDPSADVLPENQLKFYIWFSAPMSRGEAWRRLHLLDSSGKPVDLPFLEIDQELWDPSFERLTVLFDPGRIKRGVKPLVDIGAAIEAGKSYTLVVDREWLDARGAPLVESFRKPFRVTAADRTPIAPSRWKVAPPGPGTRDALSVSFGEPLDYALLSRLIQVHGPAGRVPGTITIGERERTWQFTPEAPWQPGAYRLQVDTALEDLAGNKVGRAFDVDTFERISTRLSGKTVSVPFRIGGK
jgi:hypothetical protein